MENKPERSFAAQLALGLSAIFSPAVTGFFTLFYLGWGLDDPASWPWILLFILISVIVPILLVVSLVNRGKLVDFHITDHKKRAGPLFGIFLLSTLLNLIFYFGGAPQLIIALGIGAWSLTFLQWRINTIWKISGHSAGMGSLFAIILAFGGFLPYIAFAFLLLVMWARIYRGRHTLAQSIAGAIGGFASVWLPLLFIPIP